MPRPVSTVILAAAFGSIAGTLGWSLLSGGTGSPEPGRLVAGLSAFTMMFTVPGATLLFMLQGYWRELRLPCVAIAAMAISIGGAAGALLLGPFAHALEWAGIGALYGALTGLGLLLVQLLPRFSPAATR